MLDGKVFSDGMELLIGALRPYRWKEPGSRNAYWQMLQDVEDGVFTACCKRMVVTCDEMPSVAMMTQQLRRHQVNAQGCPKCDNGKVRYIFTTADGLEYDRYCACTCEAGTIEAQRIVQIRRKTAEMTGERIHPDRLNQELYQWPAVQARLQGHISEEGTNKKSVYDAAPKPGAGPYERARVEKFKKQMIDLCERRCPATAVVGREMAF